MSAQTCLRCGAPAAADATVCFTCGAPIGEIETPTAPVPIPQLSPQRPLSPEPPAATARPALSASSAPPHARRPARPVRGVLIAVAALLVVVAVLGIAAVVRASLASLAGPPVAQLAVYRSPIHHISFTHPTLWQVTEQPDGVLLSDSDGASTVRVRVTPQPAGRDAQAVADALAAPLGLTTAPPQAIAGQLWDERLGQTTGADGAVREDVVLVTLHHGNLYTIELSCPFSSYTTTDTLVYQPLLQSFSFS